MCRKFENKKHYVKLRPPRTETQKLRKRAGVVNIHQTRLAACKEFMYYVS